MTLIDGKAISEQVKQEIAAEVAEIVARGGKRPHLAAILVGHDGGSETYVAAKVKACEVCGFKSSLIRYESDVTEEELLAKVRELNEDNDVDGFIVQLPLPKHISEQKVIETIDYRKDVDGFHPINVGRMSIGLPCYVSATPNGILELLKRYQIETSGKKCVVLGRSNIVGKPMAALMMQKAYPGDATVTVCHSRSKDLVKECQEAAQDLPETREAEAKYRANRYVALSLCSRAALYAGSIARYGTVQQEGLVGIPASEADRFFQTSYEASKAIITSGKYALYNNKPDNKAQNFCDMFLKGNGDNGEYIFQKQYNVAGGKGHDWDKRNAPFSYRAGGWGCGIAPTLELVEAYEYVDGSKGTLKLEENGKPLRFDDPYEVFANKDPRLFASVYLPGSPCQSTKIEWKRGVIENDNKRHVATSQPDGGNTVEINGVTYSTSGKDGGSDAGDASKTGFYQKKFWDETLTDMNMGKSETPWPVFRLGEIYLNLAEAAMELNKSSEALDAVNKIRERAGIALLSNINMEKIRHERRVELAFEGHRFWDMKRWRIAHLDVTQGGLNGFRGTALYPWYDIRDGKYVFERGRNTPKQLRIFLEKNYYTKINQDDMNSNPNLIQNPGYTN